MTLDAFDIFVVFILNAKRIKVKNWKAEAKTEKIRGVDVARMLDVVAVGILINQLHRSQHRVPIHLPIEHIYPFKQNVAVVLAVWILISQSHRLQDFSLFWVFFSSHRDPFIYSFLMFNNRTLKEMFLQKITAVLVTLHFSSFLTNSINYYGLTCFKHNLQHIICSTIIIKFNSFQKFSKILEIKTYANVK